MGTIVAKELMRQVSDDLYDDTQVRYSPADLIDYLNAGQRQTVLLVPDANSYNRIMKMAKGTRQTIPSDGFTFLYAMRNLVYANPGSSSAADTAYDAADTDAEREALYGAHFDGGGVVRREKRTAIDRRNRDWHNIPAAAAPVLHFIFDTRNKRNFYVYPGRTASAPGYLEIVYSRVPPLIVSDPSDPDGQPDDAVTVGVDDVYATALYYYMLHRAYMKEDDRQEIDKSNLNYRLFRDSLGISDEQSEVLNPRAEAERAEPA